MGRHMGPGPGQHLSLEAPADYGKNSRKSGLASLENPVPTFALFVKTPERGGMCGFV